VGILLFSLFLGSNDVWHCSPTQPRTSGAEAWERAVAPAQPPQELNDAFFDSFTVSSDDGNCFLEYPSGDPPNSVFAYELIEMKPGECLDVDGGTLTFCAMGAAYFNSTQTTADEAWYHYCDARMRSLTDQQARELEGCRLTEAAGNLRLYPFPVEFSDVTVREVARVYAKGGDLYVDLENERLSLEYPTSFGAELRQFLRRMARK
jgi:hypothetical protein